MSHIFLSYAHEDVDRARELALALESEGLSVWWDRRITPGQTFDEVIERALDAASHVIILWSRASVGSDWVRNEATDASTRDILVPVLIEHDVRIPLAFRRIQAADLADWHGDRSDPRFVQFLAVLRNRMSQPVRVDDIGAHAPALRPPAAPARPAPQALPPAAGRFLAILRGAVAIVAIILFVVTAVVVYKAWDRDPHTPPLLPP